MKRLHAFVLCIAPQFAVVAALVAREEQALATGTEVVLEVRPYDPMSLLSGRYVATPLVIEDMDPALVRLPSPELEPGERVCVSLKRRGGVWEAVEVSREPGAQPFLRGWWVGEPARATYGIDRFYIPETAEDPSLARGPTGQRLGLALRLRITSDGRATVEDLLVEGLSFADWNRARQ